MQDRARQQVEKYLNKIYGVLLRL